MFQKGDAQMILAMNKQKILKEVPWYKFRKRSKIKREINDHIYKAMKMSKRS